MPHPDTGTWRAWLDDEALIPDANRHLSGCDDCNRELSRLRGDATYAATTVALLDPPAESNAPTTSAGAPADLRTRRRSGRARQWATSAAAALVAVAVIATPSGRAVAGDFLGLFRSERVALISVDAPSLRDTAQTLDQLGEAGEVSEPEPAEVADFEQATKLTGLAVTAPDPAALPEGLREQPTISVTQEQQLRFTFREDATREYLSQFDDADRALPDGYDGSTLVVNIPAAVLQEYRSSDGDSGVLVGQAGSVTAEVDGDIELETLRGFLLELPGLPESVTQQLATIDDWRTTLPIPVPIDRIGGEETTVDGAEAILVQQEGLGSGLLWQRDGMVNGVLGSVDETELRAVVDSLRAP